MLSGLAFGALAVAVLAALLAGWWSESSRQALSGQPQQRQQPYIAEARDALLAYVKNPGSRITVKASREQAAAQLAALSDSRTLEEYAKVLCVQGRGSEAVRALGTQLALTEQGAVAPGDPSPSLIKIRLAQAYFTQGRFREVQGLLSGVLVPDALHAAPQWWGHLQLRAALLWADPPGEAASADSVRAALCRELGDRLGLPGAASGTSSPCVGAAAAPAAATLDAFRSNGYAVWPAPLPAESIESLRRHYLDLLEKEVRSGRVNDRRQLRHGWHNEPAAGFFHYAVAEALRPVLGTALVPTYAFSLVYLGGGQLFPHLDRPDNEVSLTISLGSDPPGYVWPIRVESEEFRLQPGNAVLYRGAEVRHAREPLPEGQRSVHVIFGFREQGPECCHLV